MAGIRLTKPQFFTLGVAATRALGAVAVQKLLAMGAGPAGVLQLGQMLLLQGLCYGLLTDGINRATMVEAGRANTPAQRARILTHGAKAGAVLLVAAAGILWIFIPVVWPALVSHRILAAVALAGGGLYWWAGPVLQFERKPFLYWLATAAMALATVLGALAPLSWLPGADAIANRLMLVAISQGIVGLAIATTYYTQLRAQAKESQAISTWALLLRLSAFGGFALAVLVAGRGADVLVRTMAMQHLGHHELGMWQASVRLGDLVLAPFIPLFGSLFFAQAAQIEAEKLSAALRQQLGVALLGVAGIGVTLVAGPWLLVLLNRADFVAAMPYYAWQAPGDALRMMVLPISIAMMAKGRLGSLAWLEAMSLGVYLLAAYVLVKAVGTAGLAMAHTVRYVFFSGATALLARDLFVKELPQHTNG